MKKEILDTVTDGRGRFVMYDDYTYVHHVDNGSDKRLWKLEGHKLWWRSAKTSWTVWQENDNASIIVRGIQEYIDDLLLGQQQ